ncbi:hypothetical protein E2C01_008229 [Portunus trituberculatus]|uniref:Uncharacterized protein n=1 Tax=Portunus trituberculatus TaxID=210409 RepID=A0A5B7D083_PORTR|nr:hypothetical protein [Portunus trituberculatus]
MLGLLDGGLVKRLMQFRAKARSEVRGVVGGDGVMWGRPTTIPHNTTTSPHNTTAPNGTTTTQNKHKYTITTTPHKTHNTTTKNTNTYHHPHNTTLPSHTTPITPYKHAILPLHTTQHLTV